MSQHEPRLLIVDDEVDACRNLSDILTDLGFQVDVAYDGPGALELVRRHRYDVALLDLKMPGMNGVELYRRIKTVSAATVAIVVTAFATSGIAQEALDAGAAEVVAKPVDLQRLIRLVEETLGQPLMMIVDDDSDLCSSLWDVLRSQGYRVSIANDGPAAEELLRSGGYQVILIDMRLPVGSGAEVFELVRKTHSHARTVLITGFRSETDADVERALAGGADTVVYKPFDVPRLLDVLKQLSAKGDPA